jgi:hypothetical protein
MAYSPNVMQLMMAIEQLVERNTSLTPDQRKQLLRDVEARLHRGEFGQVAHLSDGALSALIRSLAPDGQAAPEGTGE